MKQERERDGAGEPLDTHYQQDTAMVFGPILALIAYGALLFLAVLALPVEFRAWTIGLGITVGILGCFAYLVWTVQVSRRRE